MSSTLIKYLEVASTLIRKAEVMICEKIHSTKLVETKDYNIDYVTETDKEVESLLITGLQSHFPDHKFIGEESTSGGVKAVLTEAPTWIIDPVDGTMNFVHSNYNVAISVGLFIDKEPAIGIISVPLYGQFYSAIKGQGAFLNEKPICVSKVTDLEKALVCLECGTSREPKKVSWVKTNLTRLMTKVSGLRATGSSACNMANIALGSIDAYVEFGLHAWDMAAGALIIREAGGIVMDPSGGPFDVMSRKVLCASNENLAKMLINELDQLEMPRDDD